MIKELFQMLARKWMPTGASNRPMPAMPFSMSWGAFTVDNVAGAVQMAQMGNTLELFRIYRDVLTSHSHLQGEFAKRLLAVLGNPPQVHAVNKDDPDDEAAAQAIRDMIAGCDNWNDGCRHLLMSTLWPVSVAEKVFEPMPPGKGLRYRLKMISPVDFEGLDLQPRPPKDAIGWEPNIRIWPARADGMLEMTSVPLDRIRHIVHRGHLLSGTIPDCFGGPMRSILFWWLLSTMTREWWGTFLERYGTPFLLGKTDVSQAANVTLLERSFQMAKKLGGIVLAHDDEVEIKQAAVSDNGAAYQAFHELCDRQISKLVLGQSLSADSAATGLGSGNAELQGDVRDDIEVWDKVCLAATMRTQLFQDFLDINGLPGSAPTLTWGGEAKADAKGTAEVLDALARASLRPTEAALGPIGERLGFEIERTPAAPAPVNPFGPGGFPGQGAGSGEQGAAGLATLSAGVPLATHPSDRIAAARAKALGQAFTGRYSPVKTIILSSASPEDALARMKAHMEGLKPGEAEQLLEEGLQVCAAAGGAAAKRDH